SALALAAIVLLLSFLYTLAFIRIYDREHPWLTTSRWIYENVPQGSTIIVEMWDDALPTLIQFPVGARRASDFTQLTLPMYDDDSDAKRALLAVTLYRADLVALASQ